MTVHAAKGLEFPVVFAVNLGRGSGGGRDAIRIAPAPLGLEEAEDPRVIVGERGPGDDDEFDARELEETKRLLYVAMTRARDRLYLCATRTEDGRFVPARGSLGRVLPASLQALFAASPGPSAGPADWHGPSAVHTLIRPPAPGAEPRVWLRTPVETAVEEALAPLPLDGPARRPATGTAAAPDPAPAGAARSSALVGSLVHRLMAASRGQAGADWAALAAAVRPFVERVPDAPDPTSLVERAVSLCRAAIAQPDVKAVLERGTRLFEVAYSARTADGSVERGAIDCMVVAEDSVTVLEFKTGRAEAAHADQLDAYVDAARRLYPGRVVEGRLIYG
jgi:ATP-dependent helicase/nuclease subunit A